MISNDRKRFKCFLKVCPHLHAEVHEIGPDCVQRCWRMMPCWGGVIIQISKASKDQDGEKIEADNSRGKERQESWHLHRPKSPKVYKWPPLYKECEGSGGNRGFSLSGIQTMKSLTPVCSSKPHDLVKICFTAWVWISLDKVGGKKLGGEKAERDVPCLPGPQDHAQCGFLSFRWGIWWKR